MSIQLNPRETFTIVRQIEDHTDSATYYVRAYVRNARTDALLATIDLTDNGSQRFSEDYSVPVDASGQGFFISIQTSVFTDSGYTTKSQNYGDKIETYLVQERYVFNPNYPLPTGQDIDYKKIKKIVTEVVDEKLKEDPEPKIITVTNEVVKEVPIFKEIDFNPVLKKIEESKTKVDFSPILSELTKVAKLIGKVQEYKELDDKQKLEKLELVTIPNLLLSIKELKGNLDEKSIRHETREEKLETGKPFSLVEDRASRINKLRKL